jgi:hypothetical protein
LDTTKRNVDLPAGCVAAGGPLDLEVDRFLAEFDLYKIKSIGTSMRLEKMENADQSAG